jgi:hypothetical protein
MDRLTLYGSFTSRSSYKPMLYLALARLPFSFRTVILRPAYRRYPNTWQSTAGGSSRLCATAA